MFYGVMEWMMEPTEGHGRDGVRDL